MIVPRVGPPADGHGAACTYEPQGSGMACTGPAVIHVMVDDDHYGRCGLVSCIEHADLARAAGVIQEHPHEAVCGHPGALWDPQANRCVLTGTGHPKLSASALRAREQARSSGQR